MKKLFKSLNNLFKPSGEEPSDSPKKPVIVPRDQHPISRKNIDSDALKVLYRLKKFGHTVYLVGGGVRDLILGLPVKDYDVATSARPGQIRKTFNNCRLIGRRFRLAHILFKGKVIEVSTFRRKSEFDLEKDDLLIRSDNTFGTAEEDAFRRDFTINALFYNVADFTVIDYVGGLQDLQSKLIKTIGDPDISFQEDPIRMLRAIRLAARLDFEIEEKSLAAIVNRRNEIWKGATPRILEEIHRILKEGSAASAMARLQDTGLMEILMPELEFALVRRRQAPAMERQMKALDTLIARGETFTFPTLYAAMMMPLFQSKIEQAGEAADLGSLAEESFYPIARKLGVPKRNVDRTKQIVLAQRRFFNINRKGYRTGSLVSKPYYPEALDLFQIHGNVHPEDLHLYHKWKKISPGGPREQKPRRDRPPRKRQQQRRRPARGQSAKTPAEHPPQAKKGL